jgi:hypothetical protein
VAARIRSSAVGEQLVAALDDWALGTNDPKRRAWVLGVARRAGPDDWRDRFRGAKVWRERAALGALAGELLRDEARLAQPQRTADRRSEGCIEQEPIGMSRHLGIVGVTTASRFSPC